MSIAQSSLFPVLISYHIRVIAEVFSDESLRVCAGVQTDFCLCFQSAGERESRSPCLAVLCSSLALFPGLVLAFLVACFV